MTPTLPNPFSHSDAGVYAKTPVVFMLGKVPNMNTMVELSCCCCCYFNGVSGKLVPFTPVAIRLSYFTIRCYPILLYDVMLSIACACLLKWEETGVPGGNPRKHGENMQTPHRKARAGPETNPGPSCCEATALTTAPLRHRAAPRIKLTPLALFIHPSVCIDDVKYEHAHNIENEKNQSVCCIYHLKSLPFGDECFTLSWRSDVVTLWGSWIMPDTCRAAAMFPGDSTLALVGS